MAEPHVNDVIRKRAIERVAKEAFAKGADMQFVKHSQRTILKIMKQMIAFEGLD